jgi:hypothetical protein
MNGFSPVTQMIGPAGPVSVHTTRPHRGGGEGDRLRQPREPRADPCRVAFGEFARGAQRASLGHGQQHVAARGAHPQREPLRSRHALQRDAINLPRVRDIDVRDRAGRRSAFKQAQH